MTVPPGTPPPAQWGSGIPGIPSIWDAQPSPAFQGTTTGLPPAPRRRAGHPQTALRILLGLMAVSTVVALVGGFVLSAGQTVVGTTPVTEVAVPLPEAVGPPPPGLPGLPPDGRAPITAARADTAGEPFGLPLGTAVEVSDAGSGAVLDVLPVDVSTGDEVAVGVTLSTRADSPAPAVVPSLVLRTPDGREHPWTSASSAGGVPSLLEPGARWVATFTFPAAPDGGVLVLRDGAALAGWVVPAAR